MSNSDKLNMTLCGHLHCRAAIPDKYGEPGVSLSRWDNNTLICSHCGQQEAFGMRPQSTLIGGTKLRDKP